MTDYLADRNALVIALSISLVYDRAMWAASLSDIFNATLDGIGGLFSSLWHADIPTPNEEVMGLIAAFILLVVAAFIG